MKSFQHCVPLHAQRTTAKTVNRATEFDSAFCSHLLARGARLGEAGLGEGKVPTDDLDLLHSRVPFLQQGAQLSVRGLWGCGPRRSDTRGFLLGFRRAWLGLGLQPTFRHHSEGVALPPLHHGAGSRHALRGLHFNVVYVRYWQVIHGRLFWSGGGVGGDRRD